MRLFYASLFDRSFAHSDGTVAGQTSERWRWVRESQSTGLPVFFTDEEMLSFPDTIPIERRFGLLLESPSIAKRLYREIDNVISDFSLVFTSNSRLLKEYPNTRYVPSGGVWLRRERWPAEAKASEKTRSVSLVTSNKLHCSQHRQRYLLALSLEVGKLDVDVFRQVLPSDLRRRRHAPVKGTTQDSTVWFGSGVSPEQYLSDYRYSIVMENYLDDSFFTEKVLNCFAAGVVPIYRGARNIGKDFNASGIITWVSFRQLRTILREVVSVEDYARRLYAVEENLRLVQNFKNIEDYMYDKYAPEILSLVRSV